MKLVARSFSRFHKCKVLEQVLAGRKRLVYSYLPVLESHSSCWNQSVFGTGTHLVIEFSENRSNMAPRQASGARSFEGSTS
jgi:hypothetical protein